MAETAKCVDLLKVAVPSLLTLDAKCFQQQKQRITRFIVLDETADWVLELPQSRHLEYCCLTTYKTGRRERAARYQLPLYGTAEHGAWLSVS